MTRPYGAPLPPLFGGPGDPRYPSPRQPRRAIGVAVDTALTLAVLVGTFVAAPGIPGFFGHYVLVTAVLAAAAVSVLNRVALQRLTGSTVGKLLTGLQLIDPRTGRTPTIGSLIHQWVVGVWVLIAALGDGNDGMTGDPFGHVVRRQDAERVAVPAPR